MPTTFSRVTLGDKPAKTLAQFAGDRDRRVTFQQRIESGEDIMYSNVPTNPTVWCSIEPVATQTMFTKGQLESDATHVITCLYRSDIESTWQVIDTDGNKYQIVGNPLNLQNRKLVSWFQVRQIE